MTITKESLQSQSIAELTKLYNAEQSPKHRISKFRDKETAIKRVLELYTVSPSEVVENLEKAKALAKKESNNQINSANLKPSKPSLTGKRSKMIKKYIYKLVDKNPRREGTGGHKAWKTVHDGMKWSDYLALNDGETKHLRWDIAHGWIVLHDEPELDIAKKPLVKKAKKERAKKELPAPEVAGEELKASTSAKDNSNLKY